jgi:hypothetical protein
MNMTGFGSLKTPLDLLGKLERDLARFSANPADTDAAYDCFVVAYHLLEWKFPDAVAGYKTGRAALIQQEPLLTVAGHLANGAKHFEATRWNSVQDLIEVGTGSHWPRGYWPANYWPDGYWARPRLSIVLSATEAANLNVPALDALHTARKLFEFWSRHL